jgi:hypothetical protein
MMIELSGGQAWSTVVGRAGVLVRVRTGQAWITRQGDPEDHLLGPGQAFESGRRGRLAILALGPARLEIAEPASQAVGAGRLSHALMR